MLFHVRHYALTDEVSVVVADDSAAATAVGHLPELTFFQSA